MSLEAEKLLSALKFVCRDSDQVCRLCFASTINGEVSLLDCFEVKKETFTDYVTYEDMLAAIGVAPEAQLPQVLCDDCSKSVVQTYLFQSSCQQALKKWNEVLQMLEEALTKSADINPTKTVAYFAFKGDETTIYTGRSSKVKTKSNAAIKLKSIINSRLKYASSKKKTKPQCSTCDTKFTSEHALDKHVINKHGGISEPNDNSWYPCKQCFKNFNSRIKLEKHIERVHQAKTVQCAKCAKMFATVQLLRRHEKFHHVAAICKLCFIQFPSKNLLRSHLDKHVVNKCQQCGKTFLNRHTYKMHLQICGNPDTKKLKFFCDMCSKGYARKNSLRSHVKIEHGFGSVHSCTWCKKKFDAVSRLNNHIVKHTKERNFQCVQCGGKFVTQAALVYHTRLHTGEKPFPCDICSETFLSASRRMEHKRRKHMAPTKHCGICDAKFFTKHQLLKHEVRHNNPHSKLYVASKESAIGQDSTYVYI